MLGEIEGQTVAKEEETSKKEEDTTFEIEIDANEFKAMQTNYKQVIEDNKSLASRLEALEQKYENVKAPKFKIVGSIAQKEISQEEQKQNLFKEFFS